MHPRIYGTECEYGCFSWELVPRHMTADTFFFKVDNALDDLPALDNGGRLYMDRGSHPEYCTPECLTPLEVVIYERAGERILDDIFKEGIEFLGNRGPVRFYKTTVDNNGNTHGYHENYLMQRDVPGDYIISRMVPFLVSRVIYNGCGNVNKGFQISGRAGCISSTSAVESTNHRPIVNLRDQPLADGRRYRRLHIISGEPNMSEYATFLTIGATSLVLDLMEDGICPEMVIDKPVETLHELAGMTSGWPIKLADGRTISSVDLQRVYFDLAARHYERGCEKDSAGLRGMNREILDLWGEALDGLEKGEVADRIDWAIEQKMLQAYMAMHNITWDDPKIAALNLRYHQTGEGSAFYVLQDRGMTRRLVTDEDIETAKTTPPETRAKGRAVLMKGLKEIGVETHANWDSWDRVPETIYTRFNMPDPFRTYEDEMGKLVKKIAKNPPSPPSI